MCGRFTQKYTWEELHRLYRLTQAPRNVRPQYNICPQPGPAADWRGREGVYA
jgi:putative SOS response-associated peptidase YedK